MRGKVRTEAGPVWRKSAKPVRALTPQELERLHDTARRYVGYAKSYRDQGL